MLQAQTQIGIACCFLLLSVPWGILEENNAYIGIRYFRDFLSNLSTISSITPFILLLLYGALKDTLFEEGYRCLVDTIRWAIVEYRLRLILPEV